MVSLLAKSGLVTLLLGIVLFHFERQSICMMESSSSSSSTAFVSSATTRKDNEPQQRGEEERTHIVYMLQGFASQYQLWADRVASLGSKHATLLFHSFDKDCKGCIFRPNTTYATGNNLLIRKVHQQDVVPTNNVKYYVTLDPDNEISCQGEQMRNNNVTGGEACWLALHEMLLDSQTTHPIIGAQTHHDKNPDEPTMYQTCIDSQFFILRWDFVPFFYPFATYDMDKGWNLINHVMWHLTDRCYPNAFLVDGRFRMGNPDHRKYKRMTNRDMSRQEIINGILEHDYPQFGPWKNVTKSLGLRCSVSATPPRTIFPNPRCLQVMRGRFRTWMEQDDSLFVNLESTTAMVEFG